MHKIGLTGKTALLFLPFTSNATSAKLAAVTHVANIRHIDILSFLFMDDESHFHIALWSLAFCASSEENRWVDFARVFWSHVIIFEA